MESVAGEGLTGPAPAPGARRRRGVGRSEGFRAAVYLAPGMTGFALFVVIPLIASLVISLFEWSLMGGAKFVGLANFQRMLSGADPAFWTVLRNTIVFAVLYTLVNLACSLALSTWLSSIGEGWSRVFRVIFFVPVVTPMAGNALIWLLLLSDQGIINGALGAVGLGPFPWLNDPILAMGSLIVMSLWQGIGYNIIIFTAALNGLNTSVLEAAEIDGATSWRRFFSVVFPMLSPSVFFCTVMTVIGGFKVFAQPYFLTQGGPGQSTNTIVLYLFRSGFSYDKLGYASALAWVLFVIVMLITALQFSQQKKWVNYDS